MSVIRFQISSSSKLHLDLDLFVLIFHTFFYRLANRTVVDNGQSLNGTSIAELKENEEEREHSVRCIMNIENWTAWRLKDALSHNHCGYIHEKFPAPNVDPATREIMVGHKQVGLQNQFYTNLLIVCRVRLGQCGG